MKPMRNKGLTVLGVGLALLTVFVVATGLGITFPPPPVQEQIYMPTIPANDQKSSA